MTITPRSLDDARRLLPGVGVSIYAMTPGGPVTLELLEEGLPGEPPQAITWEAPTERACWEKAFPATEAEPLEQNRFLPSEGSRARVELTAAVSDPASELAAELTAELPLTASKAGGLFD
ncbi:hypothetical protein [Methylobacterium brachiatum]|uniref:hypothetical protein n=1 Tax=Methylobacterium brachiatum TaxID=269660 RepID=UPI0008E81D69|nr:hypothetical protein [Methylobacterium brachiatum]SFI05367.1 hypothetical protein SAMN02799642_00555 [Methylobacterium brachiatum]